MLGSACKRAVRGMGRAITRAFLDWCHHRVSLELATTREHLEDAEESYRVNGPYASQDVARDIVELRRRLDALLDEAAYIDAKRAMLEDEDSTP